MPWRGHDRATRDEVLVVYLGLAVDGQPFVIPTSDARLGDEVIVHGAATCG